MSRNEPGIPTLSAGLAGAARSKWWMFALLGALLMLMGFFVLGHLMAASLASALLIGAAVTVGGGFQVVHAFSEKGWGGFAQSLLIGLLYLAAGVMLLINPVAGSLAITLLLAAFLLASGVVRLMLAWRFEGAMRWLLAVSGAIGLLAGIVIMTGFPATGLWVLGLCVGVDLLMHGFWWLTVGFALRAAAN